MVRDSISVRHSGHGRGLISFIGSPFLFLSLLRFYPKSRVRNIGRDDGRLFLIRIIDYNVTWNLIFGKDIKEQATLAIGIIFDQLPLMATISNFSTVSGAIPSFCASIIAWSLTE